MADRSQSSVATIPNAAEVARLAALSPLEYEQERVAAAKKLGVRANILDRLVRKSRPAEDTEPREDPLQTSLDLLVNALRRYADENKIGFGYSNGCWHLYQDGVWRVFGLADREAFDRILAQLCPEVGLVFGKENNTIEKHLRSSMHFIVDTHEFDRQPFVAVNNGTVNIDTMQLVDHSPKHMTTRYIDIDFDPAAACLEWETMIDDVLSNYDQPARARIVGFIQEWMGVALAGGSSERTPRPLRKALFLYGPPKAGKSTIYTVVRKLLGTHNIVASRPSDVNNRFGLESFLTASAWITEEVDSLRKEMDTSRVKCLITGEPVTAQRKGKTDAVLRFTGPVGWAGNTAPNFPESSGAIYDRIVTIEVARTFTEDEARQKFGNMAVIDWLEAKGELPGIFNWAMAGYVRLLARGKFEKIEELQTVNESLREQNDPIYAFLRDCCVQQTGVRNSAEVLAWAAAAYAKATRNEWPKLQTVKMALRNGVPEVFRIQPTRARTDAGRVVSYSGVALNETGLTYFRSAQDANDAAKSKNLVPNEHPVVPGGE